MKIILLTYIFILFSFTNIFSQKGIIKVVKPHSIDSVNIKILNGYFIVSCFSPKYNCIDKGIFLNNKSLQLQDCNIYKSISTISYVKTNDLDLKQIDDFNYRIKLQEKENEVYLSNNPLILLEANRGDSSILKKNDLFLSIQQNIITAELIESEIEKLKLDFKNDMHFYVLLKGSVSVIDLPPRVKNPNVKDSGGVDQYLILRNDKNNVEGIKIIKDF